MSFKPIEPKRDEFRKYLEKFGVIESLTKVFAKLVSLQERPDNPMDYIRDNLGYNILHTQQLNDLKDELEEAKKEIKRLQSLVEATDIQSVDADDQSKELENEKIEEVDVEDSALKSDEVVKEELTEESTITTKDENLEV